MRARNREWLTPWEATVPPGDTSAPASFRAMVRDNAYFYDPTGLAAEGTKVDFQVGVNNYLYGTRFISYLGLTYSPDHVRRWVARPDDSVRYYADQS